MPFQFASAGRIIFGAGALSQLTDLLPGLGTRCFLVVGGGSVPLEPLNRIFEQAGTEFSTFRIMREPDLSIIQAGLEQAKAGGFDFLVALGGGSVIDAAKAMAALMTNPGGLMTYLEVIGDGKQISNRPLPLVAIPTTAGTGTEVTRNAVIASPEGQVKVSMRSPMMIPEIAVVDPDLTLTMPPEVTASTGMDALTQNIEAYVSNRANPISDVIAREGIRRGGVSLLSAFLDGNNKAAREDMALCSLFGGLALANSGLGAVHGFAGPIGGMFEAPHGKICASLLPIVMKYNVAGLQQQDTSRDIQERYLEITRMLTGDPAAGIDDGVAWLEQLAHRLKIPGLREFGITPSDFEKIIPKAQISSSMRGNPIKLDAAALYGILEEAY